MRRQLDKGKEAENLVRVWLDGRSASDLHFAIQRLPDARAARNPLAPQPADFFFSELIEQDIARSGFIEVKETMELLRLPKSKIRQFGLLNKFHLAGQLVFVVVRRTAHNDWTYFTGRQLFDFKEGEYVKSFPFAGRPTFSTHDLLLQEILG